MQEITQKLLDHAFKKKTKKDNYFQAAATLPDLMAELLNPKCCTSISLRNLKQP